MAFFWSYDYSLQQGRTGIHRFVIITFYVFFSPRRCLGFRDKPMHQVKIKLEYFSNNLTVLNLLSFLMDMAKSTRMTKYTIMK